MAVSDAPRIASGYMSEQSGIFGNTVYDFLETVPDLAYPSSIQTYSRMRTDPQLTAVLNAYTLPLRQAPKYVDPAGCRDEVVQLVADDFGIPILGNNDEPGPARRRGIDYNDHFRLALLSLIFGHMPFALRFEILGNPQRARLAELSERMPSTITNIFTNDDGSLKDILQFGGNNPIPAKDLVWYVHEREGSAWHGKSMLRSAYGAWLLKHEMWRVLATSNRRFGMGVPNVEAPPGATPQQVEQAALLASSARVGDQSGGGLPAGFKLHLTGITGSTPDTLAFIRYLDGQMAQMALASVLNLDASPNGSRALGDTFVNLLLTSLNSIGQELSTVQTGLSVRMVDYNFGEDEAAPRIVIGDAGSRPEVTAEAITALMSAGAISPDPALERWARERWTLPEKEEPEEPETPALPVLPPTDPATQPEPGQPPVAPEPVAAMARTRRLARAASATGRRDLSPIEAASGVDPEQIDIMWSDRLDALITQWLDQQPTHNSSLSEQIKAAVKAGDPTALAALSIPLAGVTEILATAMEAMESDAADQMVKEIESQGVTVGAVTLDPTKQKPLAETVATIIANGYAGAAGRQALRIWQPNMPSAPTATEVATQTVSYLNTLTEAHLRLQLGNALSMAQNDGRNLAMAAAPEGTYYASEVLDDNTCKPCKDVDGKKFQNQTEAALTYSSGGYMKCKGGLRCRGIVVAVYDA